MKYNNLGKSGLQVSRLSFGSWVTFGNQIGDDVAEQLMHQAYDAGVNFFDNAEGYAAGKSEIVMGKILNKSGWTRDSFLVSSKVFFGSVDPETKKPNQWGLSRKHIFEACHAALKRLQVDYLDLYFCHRPDKTTPIEETVWAMHQLVMQGKILYWGTSEWSAQQITEAHLFARQNHLVAPTMEQPQYNMFARERFENEYRRLYPEFGMGTTTWSPLASGFLTEKYFKGIPGDTRTELPELAWLKNNLLSEEGQVKIEKAKQIKVIADELGISLPKLGIAWVLKNPNVSTVILGASKSHQLAETLQALDVVDHLTPEVMEKIEVILKNKPKAPVF
jgi:voltage-dependent potassium channel beta subunit